MLFFHQQSDQINQGPAVRNRLAIVIRSASAMSCPNLIRNVKNTTTKFRDRGMSQNKWVTNVKCCNLKRANCKWCWGPVQDSNLAENESLNRRLANSLSARAVTLPEILTWPGATRSFVNKPTVWRFYSLVLLLLFVICCKSVFNSAILAFLIKAKAFQFSKPYAICNHLLS